MSTEITFNVEEHTYVVDGQQRPNVTRILEPLEGFFGVPPSVLEYARQRGRYVHLATQLVDEDELDWDSLDDEIRPYLKGYCDFLELAKPEWLAIEKRVYHPRYGYCGTLDRAGILHGLKGSPEVLLDIKAVAQLSAATGPQTAAYDDAFGGDKRRKRRQRYALQLKPNSTFELKQYREQTDLAIFLSLLNVHNWSARHKKEGTTI